MRHRTAQPRAIRPAVEPLEGRPLFSTTYYVSPTGLDTNPGTSPDAPFQTLAAIDALVLNAGDQVLLAGGRRSTGRSRSRPPTAARPTPRSRSAPTAPARRPSTPGPATGSTC